MKNYFFALLLLVSTFSATAQSTQWAFDNAHTSIGFTVAHMVISEVQGSFESFEGTVVSDKEDFSDAKISFNIKVSSINTANEKRDGHLASADFFNAEVNPNLSFTSKTLKPKGNGMYDLVGDLTMNGVTREVTLDAKHNGTVVDPWGNTRAGFKINGELDRTKWGLEYNSALETGGVLIGETVNITCNTEIIKQ